MARIGYKRVSTTDQTTDRQELPNCDRTFEDKASGKNLDRPQFKAMMEYIRDGDTLVCWHPDRLSRDTVDLLSLMKALGERGVSVEFKDGPMASMDLASDMGQMVLTMLAGIAQYERTQINHRIKQGMDKAKAAGKHMGRPSTINAAAVQELHSKGMGATAITRELSISRAAVYRALKA